MVPVKTETGPKRVPLPDRLAILLDVFSPWEGISLGYRQFAAALGGGVTEAAIKKWPHRKKFPADVARLIVTKAKELGIPDVTLEWVLWGEGSGPKKGTKKVPHNISVPREDPQAQYRQLAASIAQALETDLGHNDFGQWSSVEVQRTVVWALKDLARRLWALRFPMNETFKLTDEWGTRIGLPSRSLASAPGPDDFSAAPPAGSPGR
ncbi:MAG TPA: hypothetical protein VG454_11330 [Gemmatimonadales bacterium]|nr:hypothetical protein [Gemmatimonadales bacterium]